MASTGAGSVFSALFRPRAAEEAAARAMIAEVETIARTGEPLRADADPVACAEAFRLWLAALPEPLVPSACYTDLVAAGSERGRRLLKDPRDIVPIIRSSGEPLVLHHHLPVLQGVMAVLSALVVAQQHAEQRGGSSGGGSSGGGGGRDRDPNHLTCASIARDLGPYIIRPLGQQQCNPRDRDTVILITEALVAHHGLLEESVIPSPRDGDPSQQSYDVRVARGGGRQNWG
jgi:hypothetical protein